MSLAACHQGQNTESWAVEPEFAGPAVMALGDTMTMVVARYRCQDDLCDLVKRPVTGVKWAVLGPALAAIDTRGLVRPQSAGLMTAVAVVKGREHSAVIRVLPAVREIQWSVSNEQPRTGDTILVSVVAFDSARREVARLAPWKHMRGTGRTGTVLWQPDFSTPTPVVVDGPGLIELVARLAHRIDTVRFTVRQ
jgi:hypothetical protein